jgi:long-subunit acyl-CoA synthetase (AMP-forming)
MSASLAALRECASDGAAVALRGHGSVVSRAELFERAGDVAELLARRAIQVLAIAADNSPDWIVVDLATQMAGVTLVPLPLFFSAEQARHALADSGADAVVVDDHGARLLRGIDLGTMGRITDNLTLAGISRPPSNRVPVPERTAKISYTSGTTGRPKGVCLRQEVMDRVAESVHGATAGVEIERHLCLLPLATLLESVAGVYAPLLRGAEIVVPSLSEVGFLGATNLDMRRLLACLREHRAQSVILLPQMLAGLVAAVEDGMHPPPELRFAAVGGGCVAVSLLERADRLALPVYEGYGLTECASVVALNTPHARKKGSVGRPLAHVKVRIGAGGQVFVSGAATVGYVGDAPSGPEIETGDIGCLDSDGFLHITGRRKNVFITSFGRNVSPDWVEAELVHQPSIAQAALFGEARPWNVAVIVPALGCDDQYGIQKDVETANAALPDYARVHQWIRASEPFTPANGLLTVNGRNRRTAIWERYRWRIGSCYDDCLTA